MMKSELALRLAVRFPALGRGVIWLWWRAHLLVRRDGNVPDHWFFPQLVSAVGYRLRVTTRLPNGLKIQVPCNDYTGGLILREGYHEPVTVKLVEKLLAPGMVFMDMGAHVGQYTLVASRKVGPEGRVHSFEPDPRTFRWLKGNVRMNRLENVRLNRVALSDQTATKRFYLATPDGIGANSLLPPENDSGRFCEVRCTTVDDYLQANQVGRVNLIKVDIEGAEYAMLCGAKRLLEGPEKPVIIAEFEEARQRAFGNSCAKLAELLTSYGYQLFRISTPPLQPYVPRPDDGRNFHVLAVPPGKAGLLVELQSAVLREAPPALGEDNRPREKPNQASLQETRGDPGS